MAKQMFPTLFSPAKIGNLELPNRIMKAPQSTGMSNMDGSVTERLVRYYRKQAAGGTGMIIVEYAFVDDIGAKSAHCHLGISSNEHIPGLSWLAENIRDSGSIPAIQIEHCGRQKFLGTQPLVGPSAIPWPKLYDSVGLEAVPHVLSIPEIHDIISAFGDAALRAKLAGYELCEIHGAHGYLLTNFFSPHTNQRDDMYGGSLENRMRIFVEIVRDCRKKVGPDYPLTIRLSGSDYEPGGFGFDETIAMAKVLEAEGLDAIHISGGDHHMMIHQVSPMSIEQGHHMEVSKMLNEAIDIPVITSGSITRPEMAEEIVSQGYGDFVGLGRPLWADPDWSKKAYEDRPEDIRPCIRCNEGCLERTFYNYKAITCAVNPIISREGEIEISPADEKRNIAVVGGGPAGLEAARVLKLRGHDVTLYEKNKLGGQLIEASEPEFKADIRGLTESMITAVKKLDIPIIEKEATADELDKYDAVLCATGSTPTKLPLPGGDLPIAVECSDFLNGKKKVGKKIVMLGVGLVGSETALQLAEEGHDVTLVGRKPNIMKGVAVTDFLAYSERIAKTDMEICTSTTPLEVVEDGVIVSHKGKERKIPADTVLYAFGAKANQGLYDDLKEKGKEAYLIGDSIFPGKIMDAVHTAYRLARKL